MAINQLGDGSADGWQTPNTKGGFFGATPVAQPGATTAPITTAATTTTPYGFATSGQANAIVTWVVAVDAALKALGLVA